LLQKASVAPFPAWTDHTVVLTGDASAGPPAIPRSLGLSVSTCAITLGFPASRYFHLAKPNYSFEKRQREIAKKKEKDEKDARKRQARDAAKPASDDTASDDTAAADDATEPSSAG
jgi:hypothetical protein